MTSKWKQKKEITPKDIVSNVVITVNRRDLDVSSGTANTNSWFEDYYLRYLYSTSSTASI